METGEIALEELDKKLTEAKKLVEEVKELARKIETGEIEIMESKKGVMNGAID